MPVVLVVVLLPVANDRADLVNVVKGIHVQALIARATVEGFNVPVAPGLTSWNGFIESFNKGVLPVTLAA